MRLFLIVPFLILLIGGCDNKEDNKKVQLKENSTKKSQDNNSSKSIDKNQTTKDTTPPIIELIGKKEIILDITQDYIELGAIATDNMDGNISYKLDIQNSINRGVEGNYTIIYSVKDSSNNSTKVVRYVIIKDRLKELSTKEYKTNWFNKAKELWNKQNPNNQYNYNYYSYNFPKDGDRVAGSPQDNPISPKVWIKTAGLGFSKFLKYPFDEDSRYQYTNALVKEWKSKGFRNGRLHVPLYDMVDLDKDSSGATLKLSDLEKIKEICELFVKNDIPITVSVTTGSPLASNIKDDREATFKRVISWWRQLAAHLKDESYLVAFENFVEYHGFDDIPLEKREFKIKLNNQETHYEGFKNYKDLEITNWVRSPGYNNLLAEIARVIRITNPKRVVIYKPNGIGRAGLVNITPWRWGSESDYLAINSKKTPYWLLSSGGSANLNLDYIKALRSSNQEEKKILLESAKNGTWGPAINYYNATHTPVWIALFGIKADLDKIESKLNGIDVTTNELVEYINWYQSSIQNSVIDKNGNIVKVSSGFQQTPWVWDFENQIWFEGTLNNRWENFQIVTQTLSKWAKEF